MVTSLSIKLIPGLGVLFMQHTGLLCCLHLAVYNSVFPQAPTRGQGQHFCGSLIGGEGVCGCVCVSFFRSTRFISRCCSWLTLTLQLLQLWPQMSPCKRFFSPFLTHLSATFTIATALLTFILISASSGASVSSSSCSVAGV